MNERNPYARTPRPESPPDIVSQIARQAIITYVDQSTPCAHDRLVTHVIKTLMAEAESSAMATQTLFGVAESQVDAAVAEGEIVRAAVTCHNVVSRGYYPMDTSFDISPRRSIVGDDGSALEATATNPLNENGRVLIESIQGILSTCEPVAALHLLSRYCCRCGMPAEGHFCNR